MSDKPKRSRSRRATLGSRIRRRFLEPAAFRRILRRAEPLSLARPLTPDPAGRADTGRRLAQARFSFAGSEVETAPRRLWQDAPEEPPWRHEAHSFEWLDDLSALGGREAAKVAQGAVNAWLSAHGQAYDPEIWRIDIAARRLRAFLLNAALLLERDEGEGGSAVAFDSVQFLKSLRVHADWIRRGIAAPPPGPDRLTAAVALYSVVMASDDWPNDPEAIETALEAAIDGAIGPDGAVIDRSPESTWRAYAMLAHLREQAEDMGDEVSDVVLEALARLGPAVRFFRAPDGGLALFHGGRALADGRIDVALARVKAPRAPARRLKEAGFERLTGGRVVVLFDAGAAHNDAASACAHASALALELNAGRRRLITNCGPGWALDSEWAQACRGAPAQSTLTVDGWEFYAREPVETGLGDQTLITGPANVTVERKEERNGVWLMGSHDGYRDELGLRLTRRLFLSADGGDFRGEDTAQAVGAEGRKMLEKKRAAQARKRQGGRAAEATPPGLPLRARFHLHPQVSAAVVADGEAITLRLPHGEVWVMRQAGGTLTLEDSVYLGAGGDPQPTQQIVVTAGVRQDRSQIRWAFRRVGELAQLPKDIEALLVEIAPPSERDLAV